MRENIAGRNIKGAQIFVIAFNLLSIILMFFIAPFFIALLAYIIPLMFLYLYSNLYSISMEGDCFVVENLLLKKKIKKDQCVGVRSISVSPVRVMSIKFMDNKEYRFQLGSMDSYKTMFSFGGKTAEDEIFDKIQAFIDKPNAELNPS